MVSFKNWLEKQSVICVQRANLELVMEKKTMSRQRVRNAWVTLIQQWMD